MENKDFSLRPYHHPPRSYPISVSLDYVLRKTGFKSCCWSFIQKQNINNNEKEIIKEFRSKIKAELLTISEMVLTHFYIFYYVFMRSSIVSIDGQSKYRPTLKNTEDV